MEVWKSTDKIGRWQYWIGKHEMLREALDEIRIGTNQELYLKSILIFSVEPVINEKPPINSYNNVRVEW